MVTWRQFEQQAGSFADVVNERLSALGVVLVGTLRKDGRPRISPIEFEVIDGEFTFGGMWQSKKCLDMERDPRVVFHSTVTTKLGEEGDTKVSGLAVPVLDAAERERAGQVTFERTGWRPSEPYHLFKLDVREVGFVVFTAGIERFRDRIENVAGVRTTVHGEDANTSGYLVATWKAGDPG